MALLEVCVDDALGLIEALAGGADRVELCSALGLGGLTPSPGLMRMAVDCGVPCYPIIRPRSGDFCFGPDELAAICDDIRAARDCGLPGVVLGASRPDFSLDLLALEEMTAAAAGMDLSLHRCIDLCPDVAEAVEDAIGLGFSRILTSGGARTAAEGLERLSQMIEVAAGRISIMPGSGVSVQTWPLLSGLGVTEVHASCAIPLPQDPRLAWFGYQTGHEKRTDRAKVAALKALIA